MNDEVPSTIRYAKTHEWARLEDDNVITVGITHHAQDLLGDIVYVELPPLGAQLHIGDECGVVESVKAASDIYTPMSGEIIEVNDDLQITPGLINENPYGKGWIFRIKASDSNEYNHLLNAVDYEQQINAETP
jgi:glycine cleavage system H protein